MEYALTRTLQIVSEIFPTTIRAKGLTISLFTYFVSTIAYTAPGPTAFAQVGWKYYLLFICLDVVCFILLYIYLPDTTGLSLEEMGALFGDEVVTHFAADGSGLVEVDALAEFENKGSVDHVEKVHGLGDEKDSHVSTHQTSTTTGEEHSAL